ncbi:uncharacterized protein LOC130752108 [Actinidia eriantha]|uniref:uncharacterized protein LOC130752108 n=1 Tax=Actinidia eriantha TaxID=165200 RepID=UPI00258D8836|nr:uncharacterized protein LOC130752108 [Actinidia eriantha]
MGMKLNLSMTFHLQTNRQSEITIQTLEDLLRACVMEFQGSWEKHLTLAEFTYTNSYQTIGTLKVVIGQIDLCKFSQIVLLKTWCVAKPSSNEATLLENINYACSQVDCRTLQKGCPCSSPDNLISHASIVMNLYYQCKGRNKWNCDFQIGFFLITYLESRNSGLISLTDPSYGDCIYE